MQEMNIRPNVEGSAEHQTFGRMFDLDLVGLGLQNDFLKDLGPIQGPDEY